MPEKKSPTASAMKEVLWETLQALQAGDVDVATADAIASQSREIVRVVRSQQSVLQQAHKTVTKELVAYATE